MRTWKVKRWPKILCGHTRLLSRSAVPVNRDRRRAAVPMAIAIKIIIIKIRPIGQYSTTCVFCGIRFIRSPIDSASNATLLYPAVDSQRTRDVLITEPPGWRAIWIHLFSWKKKQKNSIFRITNRSKPEWFVFGEGQGGIYCSWLKLKFIKKKKPIY